MDIWNTEEKQQQKAMIAKNDCKKCDFFKKKFHFFQFFLMKMTDKAMMDETKIDIKARSVQNLMI